MNRPPPHALAATRPLSRSALDVMFAKVVVARLVIAPSLGSLALTFAFFEPTPWRKWLIGSGVTSLFLLSLVEWFRYRKFGPESVHVPFNVWLTIIVQLCVITATGGLFSPALPVVIMMAFLAATLGERRILRGLLALALPAGFGLAYIHRCATPVPSLIPELFGGAQPIEHGPAPWIAATAFTAMLLIAARVGLVLQGVFESLYGDAVQARDRSLALHAEQSRVITLMSSEIAHELKNPLASLKGLGALVAKDVEGRTAERVKVLRGEVDRMQSILEGFLTFSRPLVPLSVAEHDLSELTCDVARLHEGIAGERSLGIAVEAPERTLARCDIRKVRQVLINLVQNALDASPDGGKVLLRVRPTAGGVNITIVDEGPGLSPEIAERVFEPFVSDKEHGSGVGLVVARSLARQHGGDVVLTPRRGARGLEAELRLPLTPPLEPSTASLPNESLPNAALPSNGTNP
ncbi:MAG: HAMP domain-containing sensor histidine kinase [Myxococcales bacterium]